MANPGSDSRPLLAIGELAERKLPQVTALIERTELVRAWLESAARCECPDLGECPLFDDPPLPPRHDSDRRPRPGPGSR